MSKDDLAPAVDFSALQRKRRLPPPPGRREREPYRS